MKLSAFLFNLAACTVLLVRTATASDLESALQRAGENRSQLEQAIAEVPEGEEREAMRWLIEHMPVSDLSQLSAEYLLTNHRFAFESWRAAPWHDKVDSSLFADSILPYANVNERRDAWREKLRERCLPMVEQARSSSEAAAMLNNAIWKEFNVKYSREREKPDQSPFETMDSGLASCTGLSVLLIDSCRSVGIPARFVGTPLWSDDSGNHSWVEIWDDGWHFTGAAEPSGMDLDRGWFAGRASGAKRNDPKYAIYATSWRTTPINFPLVWLPEDESVHAVNVTDRYTLKTEPLTPGQVRVRFQAIDPASGQRVQVNVNAINLTLLSSAEDAGFEDLGFTRNESFDGNDHLTAQLQAGAGYAFTAQHPDLGTARWGSQVEDEQLFTIGDSAGISWQEPALTQEQALASSATQWAEYSAKNKELAVEALASGVLHQSDTSKEPMPFWYKVYGEEPAEGRSLFISMHGGGGAPAEINDSQWENQKKLYTPEEGVYVAPRAPGNTWNLWHTGSVDGYFLELIRHMILAENVNPDRVYLMGYSAGGDGVYQLAPRLADHFAAAAMMAGHPNETKPDGLRNLPFALHMGADDSAYDRNEIAAQWKVKLADLAAGDPGAYLNQVEIHEGKGHWMDRQDAVAVPWMAQHTRNLRPSRIVWLQDDVTHSRFYWLMNDSPKAREKIVVERKGQVIEILEAPAGTRLTVYLDDSMLDLDQEVIVMKAETQLFRGRLSRTAGTIQRTLHDFGDPRAIFCSKVSLLIP